MDHNECSDVFKDIRDLSFRFKSASDDEKILSILKNVLKNELKNELKDGRPILLSEKNNYRNGILHFLTKSVCINSFLYILNNFPDAILHINNKNLFGDTPLILATQYGDFNMIENILLFGKDKILINERNSDGNTALHVAAAQIRPTRILELLLQNGADPYLKNNFDNSPKDFVINMAELYESDEIDGEDDITQPELETELEAMGKKDIVISNRDLLVNYQDLPPY